MKHYEVYSPTFNYGRSYEPPDPGEPMACFAYVEAETPAKAKAAALRLDEFRPWKNRSDNPFTGLTVRLSRCSHGVCHCDACTTTLAEDGWACPICEADFAKELEVQP